MTDPRLRVLLVSPSFFGYERDIAGEFRRLGHAVDFLDERPSNRSLVRAVLRMNSRLLTLAIRRHYSAGLRRTDGRDYDLILVIKAEVVPASFLRALREQHPQATFVFYAYDSVVNSSRGMALADHFDVMFSFDRSDVAHDGRLRYKPLFHGPDFYRPSSPSVRPYDTVFIGTLHSDRYAQVKELTAGLDPGAQFHYFYVQARWWFWLGKYVTRQFADVDVRDVCFDKMSKADVARAFRRAKVVLDVQRTGQSGLTMRTFEALACGASLLTSNASVLEESFYDPRCVRLSGPDSAGGRRALRELLDQHGDGQPVVDVSEHSLSRWVADLVALATPASQRLDLRQAS